MSNYIHAGFMISLIIATLALLFVSNIFRR